MTSELVLNAVAEFERDLLIERTHAGLARARAEGKTMGRPSALTPAQQSEALQKLAAGVSVAQLAREYKTTRQTIMRTRIKAIRPTRRIAQIAPGAAAIVVGLCFPVRSIVDVAHDLDRIDATRPRSVHVKPQTVN